MEDWQQRVVQEQKELQERLDKLMMFLDTEKFYKLPQEDKKLFWKQFYGMIDYNEALKLRIEKF